MGLFFGSRRRNIRAWEYASFEKKDDYPALSNTALYEKLTETQLENDCRIIQESARIIAQTADLKVSKGRRKLIKERCKHLMMLKPFSQSFEDQKSNRTSELVHSDK